MAEPTALLSPGCLLSAAYICLSFFLACPCPTPHLVAKPVDAREDDDYTLRRHFFKINDGLILPRLLLYRRLLLLFFVLLLLSLHL